MKSIIATISLIVWFAGTTFAQIPSRTDVTSTPVPDAGHDYIHAPVETVNPANGSLSIRIGVPIPPSRGFTLPFSFAYDSNGLFYIYSKYGTGTQIGWATTHAVLGTGGATLSQGGWSFSSPMLSVEKTSFPEQDDRGNPITCYALTDYVFQDAAGNRHNLGVSYFGGNGRDETWCQYAGDIYAVADAAKVPFMLTLTVLGTMEPLIPLRSRTGMARFTSSRLIFRSPRRASVAVVASLQPGCRLQSLTATAMACRSQPAATVPSP